jgi:uncharacterized protein involved in outer membrane biogenesis
LRIKRLALAAGLVFIAAAAAIGLAAHVFVPRLIANLAETVKADTGRELSIGEVGVSLLPLPAITLRQVRFANAAWGSQPWLAQAGRMDVQIDVVALLSHRLHVRQIALTDASVLIETDADGNSNWVLAPTAAAGARAPAWLDTTELDELTSRALSLNYRDGVSGKTRSLRLAAFDVTASSASQPMRVRAEGAMDAKKVTAAGTVGPLAALIANAPAYPVDLDCNIGEASIGVHGTIDGPRTLGAFNLALRAKAPDVAELVALAGAKLPSLGPFAGTASVTGSTAALLFKDIDVEAGSAEQMHLAARGELQGNVSAAGDYEWGSAGLDLVAEGKQLGDLAAWIDRPLPALGAYRISARASGTVTAPALSAIEVAAGGDGMPKISVSGSIGDVRAAGAIDLKIDATATKSWRLAAKSATRLPPFHASVRLHESAEGYRLDDLELKVAESTVNASLHVAKVASRLHVTGKVKLPVIDLARPAAETGGGTVANAGVKSRPSAGFWNLADADLELTFERLVLPSGRQLEAGSGRIALVDGHVQASALQATFAGAKMQVDGSVADPHNLAGLDLKIALQGKELAELFQWFGKPIAPLGRFHGSAELRDTAEAPIGMTVDANAGPQHGYAFDDLEFAFGRSSMRGSVAFVPGEPRPRLTLKLGGPLLDLSVASSSQRESDGSNPLLAADVDADVQFERVVLPDRRELGPVNGSVNLLAGALEFKQFSVALDGTKATMEGTIADPLKPAGIAMAVNVAASDGEGIASFAALRGLRQLRAFNASGKVTDVPDGYAFTGVKLALAATTISGDVSLVRGNDRFRLQAKASSPLIDFTALQPAATPGGTAKPAASGARIIPDVILPLDLLRAIDADLDLRVDAVKLGDAAQVGPLLVRATIADGRLNAEPVELANGAVQVLHASVTADAASSAWTLRLTGSGIDLGEMLTRFGQPQLVTGGSTDVELDVQGRGKTLPAVLGSLNGNVRMRIGPNRINNVAIDVASGLIARIFSASNPFQKTDPDTEVKCIAVRVPVKDGILKSEHNAAIETAKYNLIATGTVNLRTEGLDLAVAPVVTSGLGLTEIPTIVSLSGTFSAPSVGLTAGGAIRSAAAIGATVAVPGLSNIAGSLFRKMTADPSPCATALQQ